jgi:hypothetical protein
MSRKSVKVCIRTRPTQFFAQDNIQINEEHATILVNTDRGDEPVVAGAPHNQNTAHSFRFDHVFHNASQSAVYDLYARDTVQGVVDGINGAIMTYGQTYVVSALRVCSFSLIRLLILFFPRLHPVPFRAVEVAKVSR